MKIIKVSIVLIVLALLIYALGSAALSSITLNRSVTAGNVLIDTDSNVTVKFTALNGFTSFMITDSAGKVSFDLRQALKNPIAGGYNTAAQFTIGKADAEVFSITNNSDAAVNVSLGSATGGLTMVGPASLPSGVSGNYYFKIDTTGAPAGTAINGTVMVVGGTI